MTPALPGKKVRCTCSRGLKLRFYEYRFYDTCAGLHCGAIALPNSKDFFDPAANIFPEIEFFLSRITPRNLTELQDIMILIRIEG